MGDVNLEIKLSNLDERVIKIEESDTPITVDSELSDTSTNPVQNKVITTNLSNITRRKRRNITSNLTNLPTAIAEQDLAKYGYIIGDYFIGLSGYYYYLADMDTNYGGYEINDFYIDIFYEEKTAQPADNLNPNATIVNPRTPIRFSWNSSIDQRKFELQYNVNSTGWKSIERITTERFYDMPANTITTSTGLVEWRVRVMAELGAYSSWSVGSFTLGTVAQEPPRIIKPTGDYVRSGSPISFEWDFISNTSEEQQAYEIEVTLPNEIKTLTGNNTNFHTENLGITGSVVVYWRIRVQNQLFSRNSLV